MLFTNHILSTIPPRLGHPGKLLTTATALAVAFMIFVCVGDLFSPRQQASGLAAATFTVINTDDSGAGSLRQAILDANANLGQDTITFNIPGPGVHTIIPTTALPDVTDSVVIDGYTQPGASANTLADGDNAVLLVELNGSNIGGAINFAGIQINSSNCVVRGLVINRFPGAGISLSSSAVPSTSTSNTVEGNFIGTDPSGTTALGNGDGVNISFSTNNLIGGTTPAARNVISGNGSRGIFIGTNASGNLIQGNFIGTNANGTAALSNNSGGIFAGGMGNDTIGGTVTGARNVISGNLNNAGIFVQSSTSNGATIQGNFIGTDVTGTMPLGNFFGIWLNFGSGGNSTIGGGTVAARNIISGNRSDGILISAFSRNNQIQGNFIGADITGNLPLGNAGNGVKVDSSAASNRIGGPVAGQGNTIAFNQGNGVLITGSPSATGNLVLRNSIFSNAGLGIDLIGDGVTQNDQGDGDIGPNNIQNFPVITSITGNSSQTTITGNLNSTPSTTFSLNFYSSSACDPSGNGEGTTPFGPGAVGVVTDSNGNVSFSVTLPTPLSPGHVITATATDAAGNTSEFSPCDAIGGRLAFSATNFVISEDDHSIQITVNRTGSSSQPVAVDYATSDITASERSDYTTALGTLRFAAGESTKTFNVLVSLDSFVEGTESAALTLSNPTGGAVLGVPSAATVQINDAVPTPVTNPIDEAQNFVRQHYHDFLSREPDAAGLDFWTREITGCGADLACIEIKRINVSAAFFLSIEFQETGFFAYRMFKSAYGDAASPNVSIPVPIIRLHEFIRDAQRVGFEVQVGVGDWEMDLENNKRAYALEFVATQRFLNAYPLTMTPTQFVDQLNLRAGGVLSQTERDQLIAELTAATDVTQGRASVLRKVADDADLRQLERNRAFVLMQYYGYLRRNPDDAPDSDFQGWEFWLNKLNQFNGNFVHAEMVKAFISSIEYRQRFGP